jgi:hypothetical protein
MADYARGIKAGIIASVIYALTWSIILFFTGATLLGYSVALWDLSAISYSVSTIIIGIIGGIIVGVIFASLYESLPSKSWIVKGIIAGLIFWLIFGLILGIATYGFAVLYLSLTLVFQVFLFGILLGLIWNKLGKKK